MSGPDPAPRLVVVGGGISGLAAAHTAVSEGPAALAGAGLEVLLLEREKTLGGKALSRRDGGWLVETGPTAYLGGEPFLDELVDAAGLASEQLEADPAAAHRFLVRGGRMREVHAHPVRFARSGLLGPWGMLRLALEPLVKPRRDEADESVWDFARRRIGAQAADRLIAPMVLGVFAGDARRLSLPSAFPRLEALEREHGSLVKGLLALRKQARERPAAAPGGGPAGPGGSLRSFRRGLQSLPEALGRKGGFQVHTATAVKRLAPCAAGRPWRLELAGQGPLEADAVVLAGEPSAMAGVVAPACPELGRLLDAIPCPPVAVVGLGYGAEGLARIPRGFGVLVPRGEGLRMLGCLWDSYLFPGRSPEGKLLVRVMLGGSVDPAIGDLDEGALLALARADLARLLRLEAVPEHVQVVSWPRAIPQYEIGHRERVAAIQARLAALPGLFLGGNALHGIAFAKAAVAGRDAARQALAWLKSRRAPPAGR